MCRFLPCSASVVQFLGAHLLLAFSLSCKHWLRLLRSLLSSIKRIPPSTTPVDGLVLSCILLPRKAGDPQSLSLEPLAPSQLCEWSSISCWEEMAKIMIRLKPQTKSPSSTEPLPFREPAAIENSPLRRPGTLVTTPLSCFQSKHFGLGRR